MSLLLKVKLHPHSLHLLFSLSCESQPWQTISLFPAISNRLIEDISFSLVCEPQSGSGSGHFSVAHLSLIDSLQPHTPQVPPSFSGHFPQIEERFSNTSCGTILRPPIMCLNNAFRNLIGLVIFEPCPIYGGGFIVTLV